MPRMLSQPSCEKILETPKGSIPYRRQAAVEGRQPNPCQLIWQGKPSKILSNQIERLY